MSLITWVLVIRGVLLNAAALSVLIWILALSRAPVSVVYPLLSIGYIVNAVGATLLFGEVLEASKLAGIAVIILGVYILTRSAA